VILSRTLEEAGTAAEDARIEATTVTGAGRGRRAKASNAGSGKSGNGEKAAKQVTVSGPIPKAS
jgi:hypothetical protein